MHFSIAIHVYIVLCVRLNRCTLKKVSVLDIVNVISSLYECYMLVMILNKRGNLF